MENDKSNDELPEWWELEIEKSDIAPEVPIPEETSLTIADSKALVPLTPEVTPKNPKLWKFLRLVELAIETMAGHDEYQRRKIAYYILATWHIGYFDPFPGLVLYGPPSTGKTETLRVVTELSCKPTVINADSITEAAIKQAANFAQIGHLFGVKKAGCSGKSATPSVIGLGGVEWCRIKV